MKEFNTSAIRKRILKLALPSMTEYLLKMTIGIVDMAFVGRLPGAEPLAVAGISWAVFFFFSMPVFGFEAGVTAVVARFVGAGDHKSAKKAAGQAILLSILFSGIIGALMVVTAGPFLVFMGAEANVVDLATRFLMILASSFMIFSLMIGSNAILKAYGDTKTPMMIMGFINILNVILDYGLIFGKLGMPEYGLMGSAIASALIKIIGGLIGFAGIMRGWFGIKIDFQDIIKIDREMILKIMRISGPAMMENVIVSCAYIGFTRIVTGLGTLQLAAHSLLMRAESLSYMPGIGLSVAAQIGVGQSLGEKDENKAQVMVWESTKMGMLVMGSAGLAFFLFPESIIRIFTISDEVVKMGSGILRVTGLIQPVQAMLFVMMGSLRGAGDTKTTMNISLGGMWLIRIPFAYFLAITMKMGLLGAWIGMFCDIGFKTICSYIRYKGKAWKKVEI